MILRYLHLSDLHLSYKDMMGDDWAVGAFNEDVVTRSMIEKIKKIREGAENADPFDFVLITGDIARYGKREEYAVAQVFCQRLLEAAGLPPRRLYLIPGNHDVNRAEVKDSHQKRFYRFENQDEITDLLTDQDIFPVVMRKFAEFNRFAEQAMDRQHFTETVYHMVESLPLEKNGRRVKVNLVGLNSALMAGYDGDDQKKLALGLHQTHRALDRLDETATISIGFFHHPFPCFHPADKVCENRLMQNLDLIHTGHFHEPENSHVRSAAGQAVIIGAGAAFESRESYNSFNIVEINLATGKGTSQFYKYLPNHHIWKKDTDANPRDPKGIFPFSLDRVSAQPPRPVETAAACAPAVKTPPEFKSPPEFKTQKVHFIHNYLLPKDFIGRADLKNRLIRLMAGKPDPKTNSAASLATVRGIGGLGKSCLARKVLDKIKGDARFDHIVWFSFYEARTEDEAWFLSQILKALGAFPKTQTGSSQGGHPGARKLRETLCRELDQTPILLILDGLEVIQDTNKPATGFYGRIHPIHPETLKLLTHLCNQSCSAALVTTRVSLSEFSGVSGCAEIPLTALAPDAGAKFLKSLGVDGSKDELIRCVEIFGGHPLTLKAAGKFMALKRIAAKQVETVTGDPALFQASPEGEKVAKIVALYRDDLDDDQEYFLKMLSLHPRSVTKSNFSALIRGYQDHGKTPASDGADMIDTALDNIVLPLVQKGLIEESKNLDGTLTYSAHPLMKTGFSTWLHPEEKGRAHETWADAAKASPDISGNAMTAKTIEELQPYLDVTDHYLAANRPKAAWEIYYGRNVDQRLDHLGHARKVLEMGKRFETLLNPGALSLSASDRVFLYEYLSRSSHDLDNPGATISYSGKQFHAAKETSDKNRILTHGAIHAEVCLNLGEVAAAKETLAEVAPLAEELGSGSGWKIFQKVSGKAALFSGQFQTAVWMFKKHMDDSSTYNLILYHGELAEALTRSGEPSQAETELKKARDLAEKNRIHALLPFILGGFTHAALKKGEIHLAREYDKNRLALRKSLDLPCEPNKFLLIAEKEYDRAIREAMPRISSNGNEQIDKAEEIESLLVLAQAWHGQGDAEKADDYFQRATQLMEETGCWREKDRWEETRDKLAQAKRPEQTHGEK